MSQPSQQSQVRFGQQSPQYTQQTYSASNYNRSRVPRARVGIGSPNFQGYFKPAGSYQDPAVAGVTAQFAAMNPYGRRKSRKVRKGRKSRKSRKTNRKNL